MDRIRVMLTTEGTYPFEHGGVSTWADILIRRMDDVDFVVYAVLMNPFVRQRFELPGHAHLLRVPLWGTEEPLEHLVDIPFSWMYAAKRRTGDDVVRREFVPLFAQFVQYLLEGETGCGLAAGRILHQMYQYFREYDFRSTFKSESVWKVFKSMMTRYNGNGLPPATIFDATQSLGWIYRFLVTLANPLPEVDVAHSAAAAICGVPCVVSKLEHSTPYLLTEHGVYLREQYIAVNRRRDLSSYSKDFLTRLVTLIARTSYENADQVSPVCAFNTRWEKAFGVEPERISVIHNGVDPAVFAAPGRTHAVPHTPTVVMVARIDPVKDIENALRAAALVRQKIPHVKFIIYGSVSVPDYYQRCLALRNQLELDDTFIFAGHTDDVAAAYRSGHLVALTSLSEGFPYSVIEAMMSGRAVVATDVGGVQEVLGDCGLLVPPRQPEPLASSIIRLLDDDALRESMGREAQARALTYFTVTSFIRQYLNSYIELYRLSKDYPALTLARDQQLLLTEKGYAFLEMGMWPEAIQHFQQALEVDPASPCGPVLLLEISRSYVCLGDLEQAMVGMEKAEALAAWLEVSAAAG